MPMSDELKKLRNKNYIPVEKKDDKSSPDSFTRTISLVDKEKEITREMEPGSDVSILVKGIVVADGKIKIMEIGPLGDEEEQSELDGMADDVAVKVKPSIQPSPS